MATSRYTFKAMYQGYCRCCDQEIFPGDDVAYLDDEISCETCWKEGKE